MQTPEFEKSLRELIHAAEDRRTVIMCAEAVPWRCNRSLITDALSARGITVEHIMSKTSRKQHAYTPFAQIEDKKVTYPVLTV